MEPAQIVPSIILILIAAKLFGELAERVKQPPVLGELVAGIVLGGSLLGWIDGNNDVLMTLAEIGAILLLFEVGLESDIEEFLRVGTSAVLVAVVGVVGPFAAGYTAAILLGLHTTVALYIGATLTATSVGITARTLADLGQLQSPEAKIILGAAVIDDVLGLIILAIVSGLVVTGVLSALHIVKISVLALVFLIGAILLGIPLAPYMLKVVQRMRTRGILTVSAFVFCLILAFAAQELRLAAIVGAFAAGLVLARTEDLGHIQDRVKPLADIFIPIFFVMLGAKVQLGEINPLDPNNSQVVELALLLIGIAAVTKLLAGLGVLRRSANRLTVGIGMIPRGEVGLIFANEGIKRGVITSGEYAVVIAVVVVTTFVTPPLLKLAFHRRRKRPAQTPPPVPAS